MVVRILRDVMVACGRDKRITQAIRRALKALEASIAAIPIGITVKEFDGSPSLANITSLEIDGLNGGVVSQPGAARAKVTLFPDQSGNSGKFLTTNATAVSWGTVTIPTPTITIEEVDGSPTEAASTLRFDSADGFVLTEPAAGIVRVDINAASAANVGVVTTGTQTFGGVKTVDAGFSVSTGNPQLVLKGSGSDLAHLIHTSAGLQVISAIGSIGNYLTLIDDATSDGFAGPAFYFQCLDTGTPTDFSILIYNPATGWEVGASDTTGIGNMKFYAGICYDSGATGASGTFTTVDGKTVTVTAGAITAIV